MIKRDRLIHTRAKYILILTSVYWELVTLPKTGKNPPSKMRKMTKRSYDILNFTLLKLAIQTIYYKLYYNNYHS